jgi:hypothetical protein
MTFQLRSNEFWGTTDIDPGVICVKAQCNADKYWNLGLASRYVTPPLLISMSSQLAPVSLKALCPIQYQPQHRRWFKKSRMAINRAPIPNMVKELLVVFIFCL